MSLPFEIATVHVTPHIMTVLILALVLFPNVFGSYLDLAYTWCLKKRHARTGHHRWGRHRSLPRVHTAFPETENAYKTQNISYQALPMNLVQFHEGAHARFGVAVRKVRPGTMFLDSALHVSPHRMRWGGRETCHRVRTRVRCVGGVLKVVRCHVLKDPAGVKRPFLRKFLRGCWA